MSFSNEFETRVLQWTFTTGSPTRPTAWYIGLFTNNPGEAQGGTEVSGNAYVRKAVTFIVSGDTATNSGAVEFDVATGNWGTITSLGIHDADTSGNLLMYTDLTTSKTIETGDILKVSTGSLTVTLD